MKPCASHIGLSTSIAVILASAVVSVASELHIELLCEKEYREPGELLIITKFIDTNLPKDNVLTPGDTVPCRYTLTAPPNQKIQLNFTLLSGLDYQATEEKYSVVEGPSLCHPRIEVSELENASNSDIGNLVHQQTLCQDNKDSCYFECHEICVQQNEICDGNSDCLMGEDEQDCSLYEALSDPSIKEDTKANENNLQLLTIILPISLLAIILCAVTIGLLYCKKCLCKEMGTRSERQYWSGCNNNNGDQHLLSVESNPTNRRPPAATTIASVPRGTAKPPGPAHVRLPPNLPRGPNVDSPYYSDCRYTDSDINSSGCIMSPPNRIITKNMPIPEYQLPVNAAPPSVSGNQAPPPYDGFKRGISDVPTLTQSHHNRHYIEHRKSSNTSFSSNRSEPPTYEAAIQQNVCSTCHQPTT